MVDTAALQSDRSQNERSVPELLEALGRAENRILELQRELELNRPPF